MLWAGSLCYFVANALFAVLIADGWGPGAVEPPQSIAITVFWAAFRRPLLYGFFTIAPVGFVFPWADREGLPSPERARHARPRVRLTMMWLMFEVGIVATMSGAEATRRAWPRHAQEYLFKAEV